MPEEDEEMHKHQSKTKRLIGQNNRPMNISEKETFFLLFVIRFHFHFH